MKKETTSKKADTARGLLADAATAIEEEVDSYGDDFHEHPLVLSHWVVSKRIRTYLKRTAERAAKASAK